MKQWMIWTGAGILGVALAAAMIPWVGVSIMPSEPMPEVDTVERAARASATEEVRRDVPPVLDPGPMGDEEPPEANRSAKPTAVATPAPVQDDSVGDIKHPARKEWAARLQEPDMVAARHLNSRWRELNYVIGKMEHDPAGDNTVNRMKVLQRDFRVYRRDPGAFDVEELMERQDHIIGELKQTSYWGPEMARMVQDMEAATQTYYDSK